MLFKTVLQEGVEEDIWKQGDGMSQLEAKVREKLAELVISWAPTPTKISGDKIAAEIIDEATTSIIVLIEGEVRALKEAREVLKELKAYFLGQRKLPYFMSEHESRVIKDKVAMIDYALDHSIRSSGEGK